MTQFVEAKFNGSRVRKFGHNFDIDTGVTLPEDIWDVGGEYSFPSAAAVTTIVSSDDADTSDGTGARTVVVQGVDANYNFVSETITMNGTIAVNLATQFLRVFRALVDDSGTGQVNAGNIDVKHGATILARITADFGQTLMAIYTVPVQHSVGWLVGWYASLEGASKVNASAYATIALQARPFGKSWNTKELLTIDASPFSYIFPAPYIFVPKTDIRVRCLDIGVDDSEVSAGFDLLFGGA